MQEDTVSPIIKINEGNFLDPENQAVTKRGMAATIRRLKEGLEFCEYPEWFCMTVIEYIRGVSHPVEAKLLGHRINFAWYTKSWYDGFIGINNLLSKLRGLFQY